MGGFLNDLESHTDVVKCEDIISDCGAALFVAG